MKEKTITPVWIRLLDDNHMHRGLARAAGSVIDVRPDQAKRLIEAKRAEPASAPTDSAA